MKYFSILIIMLVTFALAGCNNDLSIRNNIDSSIDYSIITEKALNNAVKLFSDEKEHELFMDILKNELDRQFNNEQVEYFIQQGNSANTANAFQHQYRNQFHPLPMSQVLWSIQVGSTGCGLIGGA